jgi:hypothetical protein
MRGLKRLGLGLLLLGLASTWALYWTGRFFASRREAEAAMDRLQPLLARGFPDPELSARVDAALAESHRALAIALGGPVLLLAILFAALWFLPGWWGPPDRPGRLTWRRLPTR